MRITNIADKIDEKIRTIDDIVSGLDERTDVISLDILRIFDGKLRMFIEDMRHEIETKKTALELLRFKDRVEKIGMDKILEIIEQKNKE
tara:strand:- start:3681 stop:3947 length:267 start_codon:yes stop_codon:yes gene_type:complete